MCVCSVVCVSVVYDSFPFQLATSFMCFASVLAAQRSQAHSSQRQVQLGGVAKFLFSSVGNKKRTTLCFFFFFILSFFLPPFLCVYHTTHTRFTPRERETTMAHKSFLNTSSSRRETTRYTKTSRQLVTQLLSLFLSFFSFC